MLEAVVGDRVELGPLERFLTSRWRFFDAVPGGELITAPVEHRPWALFAAEPLELWEDLTSAAGLPAPAGEPIVHYSPGVDTRIGRPERLRPTMD